MDTREPDNNEQPSFRIYRKKKPLLISVLFFFFLFLCCIWALLTPVESGESLNGRVTHFVVAYLGTPLFLALTVWGIKLLFRKDPILVMDAVGIQINLAGMGPVALPWAKIASIDRITRQNFTALGTVAHHADPLSSTLSEREARIMTENQALYGAQLVLAEQLLPRKVTETLAEMKAFCEENYPQYIDRFAA